MEDKELLLKKISGESPTRSSLVNEAVKMIREQQLVIDGYEKVLDEIKDTWINGQPDHNGEVECEVEDTYETMYQLAVEAKKGGHMKEDKLEQFLLELSVLCINHDLYIIGDNIRLEDYSGTVNAIDLRYNSSSEQYVADVEDE